MKISIIQGNKKYHFGVKLQSRELNLVLRKTTMIVRQEPFAARLFSSGFQSFGGLEIMKGQSSIIFQVIFHIDGHFNNSRK